MGGATPEAVLRHVLAVGASRGEDVEADAARSGKFLVVVPLEAGELALNGGEELVRRSRDRRVRAGPDGSAARARVHAGRAVGEGDDRGEAALGRDVDDDPGYAWVVDRRRCQTVGDRVERQLSQAPIDVFRCLGRVVVATLS